MNWGPRGRYLFLGIAVSAGLHGAALTAVLSPPAAHIPQEAGLKGRELIALADIEMLMGAPELDLPDGAPAPGNKAVLDSPEVIKEAAAAPDPLLAQIPYKVDDPELMFRVANPDQNSKSEKIAAEVASELTEKTRDVSAPDSIAAMPKSASGADEASQSREIAVGLSDAQTAQITDWQKAVVLTLAAAKTYPAAGRRAHAAGEVVVGFTLDRFGRLMRRSVAKSSGYLVLDAAALAVLDTIGRLPTPPSALGAGPFDLRVPFHYRIK